MDIIADCIARTLTNVGDAAVYETVRRDVKSLCDRFPG